MKFIKRTPFPRVGQGPGIGAGRKCFYCLIRFFRKNTRLVEKNQGKKNTLPPNGGRAGDRGWSGMWEIRTPDLMRVKHAL